MTDNIPLSDLSSFKRISYDDCVDAKGYPILSVSKGQPDRYFEKRFNILTLKHSLRGIDKRIELNDKSIYDVLNILVEFDPYLSFSRYIDNDESILCASALFLADFSSEISVTYPLTGNPTDVSHLSSYTDRFNSDYESLSLNVFSKSSNLVEPYTMEGSKLILTEGREANLVITYRFVDMKIQMLKEYIVPEISHLYTMEVT